MTLPAISPRNNFKDPEVEVLPPEDSIEINAQVEATRMPFGELTKLVFALGFGVCMMFALLIIFPIFLISATQMVLRVLYTLIFQLKNRYK